MHFDIVSDTVWLLHRLVFINRDRCTERHSWLLNNSSALAASLIVRIKAQYILKTDGSYIEDQVPARWKGSRDAGPPPHLAATAQELKPKTSYSGATGCEAMPWARGKSDTRV